MRFNYDKQDNYPFQLLYSIDIATGKVKSYDQKVYKIELNVKK